MTFLRQHSGHGTGLTAGSFTQEKERGETSTELQRMFCPPGITATVQTPGHIARLLDC